MNAFIPDIELQPTAAIQRLQEQKLQELLAYLAAHSVFYRRHFATHGVDVAAIKTLAGLPAIPPTTKDDLQQHNWDFLCVPRNAIAEYTSTSGTLGRPVTIALTAGDLQRLAYNESISFACADGTAADLYQLMLTLDRQFMAGIAYYEGIRRLGAGLVRVGPGLPVLQWETIQRLNPTVLVGVPSFIVKLIEYAIQQGIDLNKTSVKKIICIGEALRTKSLAPNPLAQRITQAWDVQVYGTYASTEMQTAFTECNAGRGGHHHPELLIVELLDDDGNVVAPGQEGEITITTLGVEGMPLLRYRTGDVATAHTEPCACGRNTLRLGPVLGRKQQMIKLKGTTLYPPLVFEILQGVHAVRDFVVEAYTGTLGTDELRLHVWLQDEQAADTLRELPALFQARLRVVPEICRTTPEELEKLQFGKLDRKVRKFIDSRVTA